MSSDSDLPVNDSTMDNEKSEMMTTDIEKPPVVDPNIIDWDGPDDPANPMNFSGSIKAINVGIISVLTFVTPLASSMFAPGVPEIQTEFHSTNELLAGFVVSVYVLDIGSGL